MLIDYIRRGSQPPFDAPRLRSEGGKNFAVHLGVLVWSAMFGWVVWARCHARTRAVRPGKWTYDEASCVNCMSKAHPPVSPSPVERRYEDIKKWLQVWDQATLLGDALERDLQTFWCVDLSTRPEYKHECDVVAGLLESVRELVRSGEDKDLLGAQWVIPLKFKQIGDVLRPIFGRQAD